MHLSFEDLNINTPLKNALNDLGFISPTPIQVKSFSIIMSGKDTVGIAQTGTGKTMAYLLPLLRQLKYSDQKQPRILILVPTRELVVQVVGEIKNLSKYMNLRYAGVYGGTNINPQKQLIHNGLDILVATPGRLMDLHMTGILRLKSIQKLVIDEVDEMLKQGFRQQITSIMEILPEKRQNLMFSATLTQEVEGLINEYFSSPAKIEIAPHGTPLEKIIQLVYHVPNFNTKINLLLHLIKTDSEMEKVLVFTGQKRLADRIFENIENKMPGLTGVIHSNKSQNARFNVLDKFESGNLKVLVATDIIARGLDILDVSHVINFDMPEIQGDYIHRIGRTGRVNKDGIAISFINKPEQKYLDLVEKLMNIKIPVIPLPETIEISPVFSEDEKPDLGNKDYLKGPKRKAPKGAFHEKKEKNKKTNSGSPAKKAQKRLRGPKR